MSGNRVAAVICNYNKREYVVNCIQSVLESDFDGFDLFVVDNASTDDSVEWIQKMYGDRLKLFVNQENLGGSGGFNTGIRYAVAQGYDYVWCLDNDVLVDEKALRTLYEFLETHPDTGMAGSKVYHMEAPDYVQQFGIDILWEDYCCQAKYHNALEDGSMPEVVYSDAVAACSVLVRTSLIREIGPLPEENFLYWDDTEWGHKCNLAGYRVASVGASRVLHSMGAKKETENTFPMYYAWRNWIRFFMKYTPEERIDDMCQAFLEGIFDVVYHDLYQGEESRSRTVMYAYDDALHGITGKAGEEKIFPVLRSDERWKKLLAGRHKVRIYANGRETQAEMLAEKLQGLLIGEEKETELEIITDLPAGTGYGSGTGIEASSAALLSVVMTDSIFRLEDLSLSVVYVDEEDRILAEEEELFLVINREYSRRTFIFAQKPLFLWSTDRVRKGAGEDGADPGR